MIRKGLKKKIYIFLSEILILNRWNINKAKRTNYIYIFLIKSLRYKQNFIIQLLKNLN